MFKLTKKDAKKLINYRARTVSWTSFLSFLVTNFYPVLHFYTPWKYWRAIRFYYVYERYRNVTQGAYILTWSRLSEGPCF